MRIRWTSIHSVVDGNPAAPWVGPGLAERLKREAQRERSKKDKKTSGMSERALAWFRRSR